MTATDIQPESGRIETGIIAALTAVVILGTLGFALTRPEVGAMPQLLDWQVSAFEDLSPEDQAIHSAMIPAIEEANFFYTFTGAWSTPEELAQSFVTPFYQDVFWEANGRVAWELAKPGETDQGSVYYIGRGGEAEGQSAYLAVIRHSHLNTVNANQMDFWVHPDPNAPAPQGLKPQSLITEGWRQVVTYSGASEVERLRGE